MAKLVGGAGWVVVGGAAPSWCWVSFNPTKPSTPISRTARTTPITVRRPRGIRRGRLDEETLPLTFTRLWQRSYRWGGDCRKNPGTLSLVSPTNISRMAMISGVTDE